MRFHLLYYRKYFFIKSLSVKTNLKTAAVSKNNILYGNYDCN